MIAALSDPVLMAIIAAISATVVAIPSIILAIKGTNKRIDDLSIKVDGRLTQLLEEVSKAKHAEGIIAGKYEEKQESDKAKMVDALIAKSAQPAPSIATLPVAIPVPSKPVKIEVVSMPDQTKG